MNTQKNVFLFLYGYASYFMEPSAGETKYDVNTGADCKPGFEPITDKDECKTAAIELDRVLVDRIDEVSCMQTWYAKESDRPKGCFIPQGMGIYMSAYNSYACYNPGASGCWGCSAMENDAIICKPGSSWCAKLYQDQDYDLSGNNDDYLTVYPEDDGELGKAVGSHTGEKRQWNDKVSSIKVNADYGCKFEAFENHNKEKRMWEIDSSKDNLDHYCYYSNCSNCDEDCGGCSSGSCETSGDKISSFK